MKETKVIKLNTPYNLFTELITNEGIHRIIKTKPLNGNNCIVKIDDNEEYVDTKRNEINLHILCRLAILKIKGEHRKGILVNGSIIEGNVVSNKTVYNINEFNPNAKLNKHES